METLLVYLLKASAVLGLFLAAYQVFLKRDTHFTLNRWFLLAGPLAALALPLVSITRQVPVMLPETNAFTPLETVSADRVSTAVATASGPDWTSLLLWVYGAGVCLFLLQLLRDLWKIRGLMRTGTATELHGFTYVATRRIHSPFSFFRHIFYHPDRHDPGELELILEHERAHGSQLHSLDILLGRLTGALLWINPLCGTYRKCMEQNLEYLADAQAVKRIPSLREYQYTLLKVSGNPVAPGLVNAFYHSLIKKRIVMLHQVPSKAIHRLKPLLVLPLLAAFLMAFNVRTEYVPMDGPSEYLDTESSPGTHESPETQNPSANNNAAENRNTSGNQNAAENHGNPGTDQSPQSNKTIELKIDRNTTDEELVKMKEKLADDGIDFSYTAVRNDDREIIDISVQMNGKNSKGKSFSGSYATDSDGPIEPLVIRFDDASNSLSFGNFTFTDHDVHSPNVWIHKSDDDADEIIEIKKEDGRNVIMINGQNSGDLHEGMKERTVIIRDEDHDTDKDVDVRVHRIHMSDDDDDKIIEIAPHGGDHTSTIQIRVDEDGDHTTIFGAGGEGTTNFSDSKSLFLIDGKKSTAKKASKLDPDDIERIEISKGEGALEKYGEDARHGVVEITTKKN